MSKFPYSSKNETPYAVGVGSALVDILLQESDEYVSANGIIKGGMELVEATKADELLAKSEQKPEIVPGGSACNTTIGLGRLSGKADFIGTAGKDDLGELFEKSLVTNNVNPLLTYGEQTTGRVLSVITPDAERSMLTYLGASVETAPTYFTKESFGDADLVHIEGYMLFNEGLIRAVLAAAKEAGKLISLDLASFTVIDANPSLVKELVKEYVDIVLANEDEARSYTGSSDEKEALEILSQDAPVAVVKVGKRGSYIKVNGEVTTIAPVGDGYALDTTGAGDLWASGFLYGLINGLPIEKCGAIASKCGFEVCQVTGAQIPDAKWEEINAMK